MTRLSSKPRRPRIGRLLGAAVAVAGLLVGAVTVASAEDSVSHWNWRSVEMPKVMGNIFDRFWNDNPDIDLQVEDVNFIELIQKMELSARAGAMPDTFELWVLLGVEH